MVQRKFLLGDEWLYYKLYCGISSADAILLEHVQPLIRVLKDKSYIDKWFFIRYSDAEPHIRLRLHLSNTAHIGKIINLVKKQISPKVLDGSIWNLQTDTYVREIERYGIQTIAHSETIFYHDSELVLKGLSKNGDDEHYFIFVLKCVNSFLDKLKFSKMDRLEFYKQNRDAYKAEFKIGKNSKLSLDKKYRTIRPQLETFLMDGNLEFEKYYGLIINRNKNIDQQVKEILKLKNEITLDVNFENLVSSYIHMFVNRAFKSKQRFYELLVYDFLERFTISQIKRKKG